MSTQETVEREGGQVTNARSQRSSRSSSGTISAYEQRAGTQHGTHICKRDCLVLGIDTTASGCRIGVQDWDSPQSCVPSVHISFRVQAPGKLMGLVKRCRSMQGKRGNWHEQGTRTYTTGYTGPQWGIHHASMTSQIVKDSEVTTAPSWEIQGRNPKLPQHPSAPRTEPLSRLLCAYI